MTAASKGEATVTRGRQSAANTATVRGANRVARRSKLLNDLDTGTRRREPDGAWEDDPSTPLALAAVRAGDARKARDVSALRVGHLTSATNYFVNMVGGSKAQIQAIVKSVEDEAEEMGRIGKRQGTAVSGWVCIDFDDVVVNVFSEQQRDFYSLDKFWHAAEFLDLTQVLVPNVALAGSERGGGGDGDVDEWLLGDEDDWELDDDAWSLPELSTAMPSISAPENKAPAAATPQQLMEALAERARVAQLEQRASAAPDLGDGAQQEAAEAETEAEASELPEALGLGADNKVEEGRDVDWEAESAVVVAELAAEDAADDVDDVGCGLGADDEVDEGDGVDWEAEAAAVAREMEAKAERDSEEEDLDEEEDLEEKEDWALGDDKLRDLIESLEDDIDMEVDDDVRLGGFQEK